MPTQVIEFVVMKWEAPARAKLLGEGIDNQKNLELLEILSILSGTITTFHCLL